LKNNLGPIFDIFLPLGKRRWGQVLGFALFFDALFFGSSPCGFPPMFFLLNIFYWLIFMQFYFLG
jgi:hypothetical protein